MPKPAYTRSKTRAPARKRQLPTDLPPLVRVSDLWTSRPAGKFGYTPYSRGQVEKRIAALGIKVRILGPRCRCVTREDVRRLQEGEAADDIISERPRAFVKEVHLDEAPPGMR